MKLLRIGPVAFDFTPGGSHPWRYRQCSIGQVGKWRAHHWFWRVYRARDAKRRQAAV